jgi:hypothetical protein
MYRPLSLVGTLAVLLFILGSAAGARFLYYYVKNPNYSGYTQSLVVGMGALVIAFLLLVSALLAELIASNRRLLEELLLRVRRLELDDGRAAPEPQTRAQSAQSRDTVVDATSPSMSLKVTPPLK